MSGAGDLNRRKVAFDKQSAASDGHGGQSTAFAEQFVVAAKYTHLRGGETVMADRLAGRHPMIIRVRATSQTRLVATGWRARDARDQTIYNIRDVTPTEDRRWIELLVESGVAT